MRKMRENLNSGSFYVLTEATTDAHIVALKTAGQQSKCNGPMTIRQCSRSHTKGSIPAPRTNSLQNHKKSNSWSKTTMAITTSSCQPKTCSLTWEQTWELILRILTIGRWLQTSLSLIQHRSNGWTAKTRISDFQPLSMIIPWGVILHRLYLRPHLKQTTTRRLCWGWTTLECSIIFNISNPRLSQPPLRLPIPRSGTWISQLI